MKDRYQSKFSGQNSELADKIGKKMSRKLKTVKEIREK